MLSIIIFVLGLQGKIGEWNSYRDKMPFVLKKISNSQPQPSIGFALQASTPTPSLPPGPLYR